MHLEDILNLKVMDVGVAIIILFTVCGCNMQRCHSHISTAAVGVLFSKHLLVTLMVFVTSFLQHATILPLLCVVLAIVFLSVCPCITCRYYAIMSKEVNVG